MQRTVTFQERDFVLHGRSGDPYFDNIAIRDPTNDFLVDIVGRYLPSDAVILDVGANVGVTSAIFAISRPEATIYSFEPSPETFGFLCDTVRPFGNVKASRVAMSDKPGTMRFYDNETSARGAICRLAATASAVHRSKFRSLPSISSSKRDQLTRSI
jgi:FkbM family methyltransferase